MNRKPAAISLSQHSCLTAAPSPAQDIIVLNPAAPKAWPTLHTGQAITYELELGTDGEWYATNIEIVEGSNLN
ncbi:cold shock domain-containing protein [Pseudomonas sp. MAFF212428]|uniref:Cold shock domain-containing protein n=1 Tax=Pseudomonas brassicae TaxID=2708063 RepID=A0A6B3NHG3_9PSED|nr:cold shock domain-containing protein [Pseudomonas brassicae]NER59831.1 cold shock domain-containing protein [Pseudomonas brassicae]NER62762.1 cold shock domain-containing protein [Pseudomonas brassicae]